MGPGQPGPFDVLHLQSQTQNRKDPKERKSKWLTAFGEGRKEKGYDMTESDEQIIEAVKYILNSGDAEIIHTLKVTIPAYLDCIATKMQHTELMGKTDKL
jgi:hypothetical protein